MQLWPAVLRLLALMGPRGRNIANVARWSLVAKLAAAANLFLAVPFVLHALGPVDFGAWTTLVSLVAFAGFLDFGLGNGTMNLVAAAHGRSNDAEIAAVIHEGRRAMFRVSIVLALLFVALLPLLPWYRILGLPRAMSDSSRWAVATLLFSVVLAVPLNMSNRIQLGLGRGDRTFLWQAFGQLIALGLVTVLAWKRFSFPVLTAAAVLAPLTGPLANTIELMRERSYARPEKRRPDLALRIRKEGWLFFILQLAAALAYSADLPLISALAGPEDAGNYAIIQRVFSIIPLGLGLIWVPLWPVYRQTLASGQYEWALQTLKLSTIAAVCIAAVLGTVIAFGFEPLIMLWLRQGIVASALLLAGFATWAVFEAGASAVATFLNAASVLHFQVIIACAFALCCITGKVLALANGHVSWLPWVTLVSWFACALLPLTIYRRKIHASVLAEGH